MPKNAKKKAPDRRPAAARKRASPRIAAPPTRRPVRFERIDRLVAAQERAASALEEIATALRVVAAAHATAGQPTSHDQPVPA